MLMVNMGEHSSGVPICGWFDLKLPITEQIHDEELSLPISQVLTQEEADEVVRLLNAFK